MVVEYDVKSVLRQRALTICQGIDGRAVPDLVLGRLAELADIAGVMGLDGDAARLSKLLAVAKRGYTSDLERAALSCLVEDVR
jgi:hypothetical protein